MYKAAMRAQQKHARKTEILARRSGSYRRRTLKQLRQDEAARVRAERNNKRSNNESPTLVKRI